MIKRGLNLILIIRNDDQGGGYLCVYYHYRIHEWYRHGMVLQTIRKCCKRTASPWATRLQRSCIDVMNYITRHKVQF